MDIERTFTYHKPEGTQPIRYEAIRETAKELGLNSPFEANTPVGIGFSTDLKPQAVAAMTSATTTPSRCSFNMRPSA
jgi:hypothetical protein